MKIRKEETKPLLFRDGRKVKESTDKLLEHKSLEGLLDIKIDIQKVLRLKNSSCNN